MATKIFELPQLKAEVILTQEYTDTNLVVAGGRAPQIDWLKEAVSDRKVYCADKGIEVCMEADIIPEELYGDGDSADAQFYWQASALGTKVRTFPTAKDDTDLQLLLKNLPAGDVICSGVWGGRFDHLYSNVFSLLAVKEKTAKSKIKVKAAPAKKELLLPEDAQERLNRFLLEISMEWLKNKNGDCTWKVLKEGGQIVIKPVAKNK